MYAREIGTRVKKAMDAPGLVSGRGNAELEATRGVCDRIEDAPRLLSMY
jgi:hypothetical protein